MDPIALSYLLEATGPVEVSGQQLTADNAVSLLLNERYLTEPDAEAQDRFFALAARRVFDALSSGQADPGLLLDGLARAAEEDRALVWSDQDEEQQLLAPTSLSGVLPTDPAPSPSIGVYLNDGTGAKLDYYLDYQVDVRSTGCDDRGVQTLEVVVAMQSEAPANAADLPVSVIGPGFGTPAGTMRTNVLVYAPTGGEIGKATMTGERLISARLEHEGRQVAAQTIDLAPGDERVLTFSLTSGPQQPDRPDVRVTPGMPGSGGTTVSASACD